MMSGIASGPNEPTGSNEPTGWNEPTGPTGSTEPAVTPVVVGTDGSPPADRAVAWAAEEAALRRRPLHLVHVTERWMYDIPLFPAPGMRDSLSEEGVRILAQAKQLALDHHPELTVTTELVEQATAHALSDASAHAFEVVLGHRGLGGFASMLLGSTGLRVTAHAYGPVVIVRGETTGFGESASGDIVVGTDLSEGSAEALEYAFEAAAVRKARLRVIHSWRVAETLLASGSAVDVAEIEGTRGAVSLTRSHRGVIATRRSRSSTRWCGSTPCQRWSTSPATPTCSSSARTAAPGAVRFASAPSVTESFTTRTARWPWYVRAPERPLLRRPLLRRTCQEVEQRGHRRGGADLTTRDEIRHVGQGHPLDALGLHVGGRADERGAGGQENVMYAIRETGGRSGVQQMMERSRPPAGLLHHLAGRGRRGVLAGLDPPAGNLPPPDIRDEAVPPDQ
jgi:nucleotide-binding universal stress UspA family protein